MELEQEQGLGLEQEQEQEQERQQEQTFATKEESIQRRLLQNKVFIRFQKAGISGESGIPLKFILF